MTGPQDDKPWAAWTASAMLARKPQGWWRRNVWGLVLILPAVAFVVAVRWDSIYYGVIRSEPLIPVNAAQQEWVDFKGAKMRLTEFAPATGLVASGNKPLALPDGVKAWRAVIEFQAPDQEALEGCKFQLEDTAGRLYSDRPDELSLARGLPIASCVPLDEDEEERSSDYSATVVFVMPSQAQPAAVRITWLTQYPRFVRLTIAG